MTALHPHTAIGVLIAFAVILLTGLTVHHVLSVQESERARR